MSEEKRYLPVSFKKKLRAFATTPTITLPTEAQADKSAHTFLHEAQDFLRFNEAQSASVQEAIKRAIQGVVHSLADDLDRIGLTDAQTNGVGIMAGWSLIVTMVDMMRSHTDPLSRQAYLAQLTQHLQFTTSLATQANMESARGGVLPGYDDVANKIIARYLDTEGCGSAQESYEHAEQTWEGAQARQEDLPDNDASPLPDLGFTLGGLSSLLDALNKIPAPQTRSVRTEAKDRSSLRGGYFTGKSGKSGKGMLAIELIPGESGQAFRARIKAQLLEQGVDEAIANRLVDLIGEQFDAGMFSGDEGDE